MTALLAVAVAWLLRADGGVEAPAGVIASPSLSAPPVIELPAPADQPAAEALLDSPPPVGALGSAASPASTPTAVQVVVVDERDAEVPRATVEALRNPGREDGEGAPPLATWRTDAAGRCTLEPPAEETWLFASKAGVGCSERSDLRWLRQQATPQGEVVLRLVPRSRLRGLVLEPDDSPAAGALVRFWAFGGPVGRVPADLVTGPDGRFETEVDAGTRLALSVEDGDRRGQEFRFRTEPRGDREVVLRLTGDWSVSGIVFDRLDAPVTGAKVTLWRDMPDWGLPPEQRPDIVQNSWFDETLSGPDGRFRFAVRERLTYTVIARVGLELPTPAAQAVIDERQGQAWVELRPPEPSFLAGDVVRADGSPAKDITLDATTADWFSPHDRLFAPQPNDRYGEAGHSTSGPDGRFRIDGLHPDGTYTLRVRSSALGHAEAITGARAGTGDLHIQLADGARPESSVVFEVVSGRDGVCVESPEIHVVRHIENGFLDAMLKRKVLSDGRSHLDGFRVGETYSAWVLAPGHAALDLPAWTAEAGEQERRVELPQPGYLDIEVSLPGGRPAAWADVRLFPSIPRLNTRGASRRAADIEGRVSFGPFDPGPMRVHVLAAGVEIERDLVVGDGAHEMLRIEMPP